MDEDELGVDESRRVDLVARGLSALVEQEEAIGEVTAWLHVVDNDAPWRLTCWKCDDCGTTHVEIQRPGVEARWDRERADERMFGSIE